MKIEGPYNPKQVEDKIYKLWEDSGFFNPDKLPARHKKPFSMVLPPPNVTGTLHIGHALTATIEDIIIRYQRMLGKKTLWLPGTDHASIATETKFLKETGIKRSEYNQKREEFVNLVNDFALKNQSTIIGQLRSMGASLDWTRLSFTLDQKRQEAVYEAFYRLNKAGLIYHGEFLVNWDIKGQTTVSDEEVEYQQEKTTLYTFKYSKDFPISIATTRPETKLGDTAVAVHPKGKWKEFIGKEYDINDFSGVKLNIKIVGDDSVDEEFGTGAVGITPAHSKIDYEISQKNNLPLKQVINEYGKIINSRPDWDNQINIKEAREKVVQWLKDNNLLENEEVIDHNIAKAQRSGGVIEILPKRHQFFINVNKKIPGKNKTIKELLREAVTKKKIKIIPSNYGKIYLHWIDNLHDWNISRQVWYGHKIPAWYKNSDIKIDQKSPGDGWQPINDTFDTWFSSGLWTFSTLGWPEKTKDLETYHPTNVLETGYDILPFWVARMILMSICLLDEIPFHTVYLHGLVRDAERRKMSKSLGNVIDPLSMTEKYGTDALRFALAFGSTPGTDSIMSEDRIKGMKNFANKIWNASKFVLMNTKDYKPSKKVVLSVKQKKHLKDLKKITKEVTKLMDDFKFYYAAEKIYHYFWHNFCDKIIEESKKDLIGKNKAATQYMLLEVLLSSLKLLHPFMPFITEEIYQQLPVNPLVGGKKECIMIENWPI